jgi:hypothetical protein
VHLVILPRADVFVPVGLHHSALTVFFSCFEVTRVLSTVFKREFALALKLVLSKLALVCFFGLCEVINAIPVEHTVLKVALIKAAVRPFVATSAAFFSLNVLAFKLDRTVVPSFFPESMLQIIDPRAI